MGLDEVGVARPYPPDRTDPPPPRFESFLPRGLPDRPGVPSSEKMRWAKPSKADGRAGDSPLVSSVLVRSGVPAEACGFRGRAGVTFAVAESAV